KNFVKFVCHKENFCNFVFGEHSDYCLYYFVIEHYKGTTIFANHQIYRQLYFVELTLITSPQLPVRRLLLAVVTASACARKMLFLP
ncbi:MAG: hypothetical protein K5945_01740, partial [Bacteroidaceae bacterium]|nr:hypothetical protein [Bacteroidaceae bacterium]